MASALRSAARKETAVSKKTDHRIIVAADVPDLSSPGNVLFTKDQIIEAIDGFAEGDRLEKQGKALKQLHEPTVEQWGVNAFARRWADQGQRPDNPTLTSGDTGTIVSMAVKDQSIKLNDQEFARLANLIGAKQAEANVIKREEIAFDQDLLQVKVAEAKDDKGAEMTVLDIIDKAISDAFEKLKRTDCLTGLFVISDKFATQKGLLDKAVGLVGKDSRKLAEFIEASKAPVALRAGSSGK